MSDALSNEQKLYAVTIERTIMVVAENETAAEQLASEHEREETFSVADYVHALPVSTLSRVPKAWRECLPYGGDGKTNCQDFISALKDVSP
jgi:hypothetical protein